MWYEAMIPLGIVAVCLSVPTVCNYWSNVLMFGNPYRRNVQKNWDLEMFIRDNRITNDQHWKTRGLDYIPDE